ncbi:hypothetical protein G3T37_12595 [Galbitalea soli]|uniref:Helicase n=1 Tax=Galbitalea soli TaxID=1268042 RepID=A0A7C9PPJ1_9MICO|nr:hypothetical protein [Galbitalea soli]
MLAVAIIGAICAVALSVLPVSSALAERASVGSAADAAALAGADVAAGLAPGEPCAVAARIARANGAVLTACGTDGPVVTVTAETVAAGIPVVARARAGPPGWGTD